ncbi:MAG: hypothetical protein ACOCYU_02980 [Brevefilum sp.]
MDHVFTGVYNSEDNSSKIVGQVYQSPNMSGAHINYLLQPEESDPNDLVILLEGLVKEAGYWGAKQITADLDTDSALFPQFRRAGFSVLAKQRIFHCAVPEESQSIQGVWRIWTSEDIPIMRRLYLTLVPPLIQPVEPLTRRETLGLVLNDNQNRLQAYADLVYGPVGIWVLPLVHPKTEIPIDKLLSEMLRSLPDINGRPVYVTARSYQPWVESGLESIGGLPGPEQGLMIHYMAMRQRLGAEFSFAPVEKNGKPETTVPYSPISNHYDG